MLTYVHCLWKEKNLYFLVVFFSYLNISILIAIKMDSSIKLFQIIQKHYQSIGIYGQNRSPINLKNWIFFICVIQLFAFPAIFLTFFATTMFEYGMILYALISITFCTSTYLFSIWQLKNMFEFEEFCEEFIGKRK